MAFNIAEAQSTATSMIINYSRHQIFYKDEILTANINIEQISYIFCV